MTTLLRAHYMYIHLGELQLLICARMTCCRMMCARNHFTLEPCKAICDLSQEQKDYPVNLYVSDENDEDL